MQKQEVPLEPIFDARQGENFLFFSLNIYSTSKAYVTSVFFVVVSISGLQAQELVYPYSLRLLSNSTVLL